MQRQFCQRGRAAKIVAVQYLKLTPLQLRIYTKTKAMQCTFQPSYVTQHMVSSLTISLVNLLWNSQPHFLLEVPFSNLNTAKRRTFDGTQVLELILQDGSDNETEVDHYDSIWEQQWVSEDEDFLDDVPEINDDPDYLSDEDLSALLIV